MRIRTKHIKSIGAVLFTVGFVLSVSAMFISEEMGITNNLHMIEHFMGVFILGAIMLCGCDLWELWR